MYWCRYPLICCSICLTWFNRWLCWLYFTMPSFSSLQSFNRFLLLSVRLSSLGSFRLSPSLSWAISTSVFRCPAFAGSILPIDIHQADDGHNNNNRFRCVRSSDFWARQHFKAAAISTIQFAFISIEIFLLFALFLIVLIICCFYYNLFCSIFINFSVFFRIFIVFVGPTILNNFNFNLVHSFAY